MAWRWEQLADGIEYSDAQTEASRVENDILLRLERRRPSARWREGAAAVVPGKEGLASAGKTSRDPLRFSEGSRAPPAVLLGSLALPAPQLIAARSPFLPYKLTYCLHPNSRVVSPRLHITKSRHRAALIGTTPPFCKLFPASIRASTPFPALKSPSFGLRRVPILRPSRRHHLLPGAN